MEWWITMHVIRYCNWRTYILELIEAWNTWVFDLLPLNQVLPSSARASEGEHTVYGCRPSSFNYVVREVCAPKGRWRGTHAASLSCSNISVIRTTYTVQERGTAGHLELDPPVLTRLTLHQWHTQWLMEASCSGCRRLWEFPWRFT